MSLDQNKMQHCIAICKPNNYSKKIILSLKYCKSISYVDLLVLLFLLLFTGEKIHKKYFIIFLFFKSTVLNKLHDLLEIGLYNLLVFICIK